MPEIDLDSENFRTIGCSECIVDGTLVWLERNDHFGNTHTIGPLIIQEGWNPTCFEAQPQNGEKGAVLICPYTGEKEIASYRSFLY